MTSIAKDEVVGRKKGSRIADCVQKYEGLSGSERGEGSSIALSRPDIARVVASKKDSRLSLEIKGQALSSSSLQFVMGLVNRKLDADDEEALKGFVDKLDSPRVRDDAPTTEEERQEIVRDAKAEEVVEAFVDRVVENRSEANLLVVLERLIERYRRCVDSGCPNWLLRLVECSIDPYAKKWNASTPRERKAVVEEFGDKAKALDVLSNGFPKIKAARLIEGLGREEYEEWSPCETGLITKLGSLLY